MLSSELEILAFVYFLILHIRASLCSANPFAPHGMMGGLTTRERNLSKRRLGRQS